MNFAAILFYHLYETYFVFFKNKPNLLSHGRQDFTSLVSPPDTRPDTGNTGTRRQVWA